MGCFSRLSQGAAVHPHFVLRLVVDIGLARADQVLGPRIELLEIVRRMIEMLAPVKTEPAHIVFDGIDIFLFLLGGIGVVEAQMAAAPELLRYAEVQTNGFGVADVQIAVRLRRKACDHGFVPSRVQIALNDVTDEIAAHSRCVDGRHFGFL